MSFFVFRIFRIFQRLTKGVKDSNLEKLLAQILAEKKLTTGEIKEIKEKITRIDQKEKFYFQKIGLVRFNPFADSGGDQSFALSLLDGKDEGLVITGLHSRQSTRVYAKLISDRSAKLSREELAAVKKAK